MWAGSRRGLKKWLQVSHDSYISSTEFAHHRETKLHHISRNIIKIATALPTKTLYISKKIYLLWYEPRGHAKVIGHAQNRHPNKYTRSYIYGGLQHICFRMYSISQAICTRFLLAVLCCGYTLTDFPISIRLTSLALRQSNDCPSASKATLMNMDKYFMWIHYEELHNHNKAKHNKTVCIFPGIYCNAAIACSTYFGLAVYPVEFFEIPKIQIVYLTRRMA